MIATRNNFKRTAVKHKQLNMQPKCDTNLPFKTTIENKTKRQQVVSSQDKQEEEEQNEGDNNDDDYDANSEEKIVIDLPDEDEDSYSSRTNLNQFMQTTVNLENENENQSMFNSSINNNNDSNEDDDDGTYVDDSNNNSNNNIAQQLRQSSQEELDSDATSVRDKLDAFNVGDLVWFDANKCGFCVPGKVIDVVASMQMLRVEGPANQQQLGGFTTTTNSNLIDNLNQNSSSSSSITQATNNSNELININSNRSNFNRSKEEQEEEFEEESNNAIPLSVFNLCDSSSLSSVKPRRPFVDELGVADLQNLPEFSSEAIAWNLRLRFAQGLPFAKCGKRILVSVNAKDLLLRSSNNNENNFKKFDNQYSTSFDESEYKQSAIKQRLKSLDIHQRRKLLANNNCPIIRKLILLNYQHNDNKELKLINNSNNNKTTITNNNELNVYNYCEQILESLLVEMRDQSVLLLGDSGSGKTFTCQILANYLTSCNETLQTLLESSLKVLQIFTSAKTTANEHSSRVPKLVSIRIDANTALAFDASIRDFNFADKSRIVAHASNERSMQVFYAMLAGLSDVQRNSVGLTNSSDRYFYLNQGNVSSTTTTTATATNNINATANDCQQWQSFIECLRQVGVFDEELNSIVQVLASILHLGNIYFNRKLFASVGGGARLATSQQLELGSSVPMSSSSLEGVQVGSDTELRWLAHLLQVDFDELLACLTVRVSDSPFATSRLDKIISPLNIDDALDSRDAIARSLYSSLIKWLLKIVNNSLIESHANNANNQRIRNSLCEFEPKTLLERNKLLISVHILDAFGFASLADASFEQFCANCVCEELQAQFARSYLAPTQIRKQQQQYYKQQQIETLNSSSMSQLLVGKPLGILSLLDDECNFPKASDASFVHKCHFNHALNKNFGAKQTQQLTTSTNCVEFEIKHFTLESRLTTYDALGFVDKNRDFVRENIIELLSASKLPLVKSLSELLRACKETATTTTSKTVNRSHDGRFVSMKPRATTAAARLFDALNDSPPLTTLRQSTTPTAFACSKPVWFVCCLKPVVDCFFNLQQKFDVQLVEQQIKAFELSKIAQSLSLSHKYSMREFVLKFACIVNDCKKANKIKLLAATTANNNNINNSKLLQQQLQAACKLIRKSVLINQIVDEENNSKQFEFVNKHNNKVLLLADKLNEELEVARLNAFNKAVNVLQRTFRMWKQESKFRQLKKAAIIIQATFKAQLVRKNFQLLITATICLQRAWRLQLALRRKRQLAAKRRVQRQQVAQLSCVAMQSKLFNSSNSIKSNTTHNVSNKQQLKKEEEQHYLNKKSLHYATSNSFDYNINSIVELKQLLANYEQNWQPLHSMQNIKLVTLFNRRSIFDCRTMICAASNCCATIEQKLLEFKSSICLSDLQIESCASLSAEQSLLNALNKNEDLYSIKQLIDELISEQAAKTIFANSSSSSSSSLVCIKRPLLRSLSNSKNYKRLQLLACNINKIILHYINILTNNLINLNNDLNYKENFDNTNSKQLTAKQLIKHKLLADYVIYVCLCERELRDEIYVQLVSLICAFNNDEDDDDDNDNDSSDKNLNIQTNVWKLMANCASCFLPTSKQLAQYLLKFADDYCGDDCLRQLVVEKLAKFFAFPSNENENEQQLERQFPPSLLEYFAIEQRRRQLTLQVFVHLNEEDDCDYEGKTNEQINADKQQLAAVRRREQLTTSKKQTCDNSSVFVLVDSWSSAASVARATLKRLGINEQLTANWSIELKFNGSNEQLNCRVRGDHLLFDHLARVEMQPKFVSKVASFLNRINNENNEDNDGHINDEINDDVSDNNNVDYSYNMQDNYYVEDESIEQPQSLQLKGNNYKKEAKNAFNNHHGLSMQKTKLNKRNTQTRLEQQYDFKRKLKMHSMNGSVDDINTLSSLKMKKQQQQQQQQTKNKLKTKPKFINNKTTKLVNNSTFVSQQDISDSASIASHVRAVKVPSCNANVKLDKYLDDLFKPMLDVVDDKSDEKQQQQQAPTIATTTTDNESMNSNSRISPTVDSLLTNNLHLNNNSLNSGSNSNNKAFHKTKLQQTSAYLNKSIRNNKHCEQLVCATYANVNWRLVARKEFFSPAECYDEPLVAHLIFAQLVSDVFDSIHASRLANKERVSLRRAMKKHSIGYTAKLPSINELLDVKLELIRLARAFGLYFTRAYPATNFALTMQEEEEDDDDYTDDNDTDYDDSDTVNDDNYKVARLLARQLSMRGELEARTCVDLIAVHHTGARLVAFARNSKLSTNKSFKVLRTLKFRDILDIRRVGARVLLVRMRSERQNWLLDSQECLQLTRLLKSLLVEYNNLVGRDCASLENVDASDEVVSSFARSLEFNANTARVNKHDLLACANNDNVRSFIQRQAAASVGKLRLPAHARSSLANSRRVLAQSGELCTTVGQQGAVWSQRRDEFANSACAKQVETGALQQQQQQKQQPFMRCASKRTTTTSTNEQLVNSEYNQNDCYSKHKDKNKLKLVRQKDSEFNLQIETETEEEEDNNNKYIKGEGKEEEDEEKTKVARIHKRRAKAKSVSLFKDSISRMSMGQFSVDDRHLLANDDVNNSNAHANNKLADLGAWIETKVDFGHEDDEDEDEDEKEDEDEDDDDEEVGNNKHKVKNNDHYLDEDDSNKQQYEERQANVDDYNNIKSKIDRNLKISNEKSIEKNSLINSSNYLSNIKQTKKLQANKQQSNNDNNTTLNIDGQQTTLNIKSVNSSHSSRCSTATSSSSSTTTTTTKTSASDKESTFSMLEFALSNFRHASQLKLSVQGSNSTTSSSTTTTTSTTTKTTTSRNSNHNTSKTQRLLTSLSNKLTNNSNSSQVADWSWRELTSLIKFTEHPISASLLKLPAPLSSLAVDCFAAVMHFMGDLPSVDASSDLDAALLILAHCHKFVALRDELFCQVVKQTTSNKSVLSSESCARGWRLLSLLAAYFDCSPDLQPYLHKYLETAAFDKRRAHCAVALQCVKNLRKTRTFGGRKNVPSADEIAAIRAGRNSKRQLYRLPGGTKRVVNTNSTTVVADVVDEICTKMLGIDNNLEMLEFSLYCIVDNLRAFETIALDRGEYILDVTTELARLSIDEPTRAEQQFYLIFCRSVWYFPLKFDNKLYIEVVFNQIAPDYIEGLLLELPINKHLVNDIARIAALLHKTARANLPPTSVAVLSFLLPKPVSKLAEMTTMLNTTGSSVVVNNNSNNDVDDDYNDNEDDNNNDDDDDVVENQIRRSSENLSFTSSDLNALQWTKLVHKHWRDLSALDALDAKAQFLEIVSKWPLFGSTFFAVQLIERDLLEPIDFILALNKLGVQLLDVETHEQKVKFSFSQFVSTRKVRSHDLQVFLDLKIVSNVNGKPSIVRIKSDEANEISRLIKLYIDIDSASQANDSNSNSNTVSRSNSATTSDTINARGDQQHNKARTQID